jgi:hypothetical protein
MPSHATIIFDGFADGVDGGSGNVGADWSSDWGPDYRAYPNGVGNYGGTTTPTPWPNGSFHSNETLTIEVLREPNPDSAAYLRSTAIYDIGPSGPVGPDVVHHYRIENIVYNPHCCFGLSVGGALDGSFAFSGVSAANPLYWAASWSIEFVTPGSITNNVNNGEIVLLARNSELLRIPAGPLPPSTTISGAATGSTAGSRIVFSAFSGLSGTGMLGESRVTLDLQIQFADRPILTADFDQDGDVDIDDLSKWRADFATNALRDADNDGDSDGDDFLAWQRQLGSHLPVESAVEAVPEPGAAVRVLLIGCALTLVRTQHRPWES